MWYVLGTDGISGIFLNPFTGGAWCSSVAGISFAPSAYDSLGVHLRSTGHSQPITSGVGFDPANQERVSKNSTLRLLSTFFPPVDFSEHKVCHEDQVELPRQSALSPLIACGFHTPFRFTHNKAELGVTCPGSKWGRAGPACGMWVHTYRTEWLKRPQSKQVASSG